MLDRIARAIEPLLDAAPARLPRPRWRVLGPLAAAARGALALGADLPGALALLLGPARPVLESWFESEPLRATLATDAVIGAFAGPSQPGTGYVLVHHVMGDAGGGRGVWAYVRGGMGALAEALAAAARSAGAEIRTGVAVRSVRIRGGRADGVVLEDGAEIAARAVVSNADPWHTFLRLVPDGVLPDEFSRAVAALDFRSPSLKINAALDRLPAFFGRDGGGREAGPVHRGTIHAGAADLAALDASFEAARAGRLPERPMIELTLPSALDPSLAPAGRHVASLFVQHVPVEPTELDGGWDAARDRFADRVFALLDEVSPGFSASVLEREVLAPPDLERIFGLRGGNLFHGAMTPDRLAWLRPLPGWSRYRTPLPGLWLCGAGTHPGGGVMGACGRNAARELVRGLGRGERG
jgi:phytoene dehydrogenase-like protein